VRVAETSLAGLLLVEPTVHEDERGQFLETWQARRYADAGMAGPFVQDNLSVSKRGVLRGLHYQLGQAQAKLVSAVAGEVFDVVVDLRQGSKTFGRWESFVLSEENRRQLFVPEGMAHGFQVTSASASFLYKCSDYYAPAQERGIRWDDSDLAIDWPDASALVGARDEQLPRLREVLAADLPSVGS